MNVLILTADYPPIEGGISTVTVQVARELARAGHEVTVVAPYFPGQAEFDALEPVSVVRYRGYHAGWLRLFPMWAASLPRLKGADVLLGINVGCGGLIGRVTQLFRRVPYVTFAYAYEFLKFPKWSPWAWLLRSIYARSRLVVAISRFTRDQLVTFGAPEEKVVVILPGAPAVRPPSETRVEHVRHRYVLDSGPIVLAVGRFVRRKGQITLVRALPRILSRVPDAHLVLVGQGPRMYEVIQEAYALGVRDHIVLPGRLSDKEVAALYEACTVFALPTGEDAGGQVEGFGLVFVEAQAYGKPVVAGRSGGVVDAVVDGETGLIVDPGNAEMLADAILRLLEDSALARRLGENGRRRVETELNWTAFTRRLLEALEARL
jgi:phosphatidylinositol alpha-1,6-mannosyltransferase